MHILIVFSAERQAYDRGKILKNNSDIGSLVGDQLKGLSSPKFFTNVG